MRALLTGVMDTAKKNGGNTSNAVAMGYCFGGAAVLEMARSGAEMKGFVFSRRPKDTYWTDYKSAKGKILVFHGSVDTAITLEDFGGLVIELENTGVSHEMITYM